MIPPELWGGDSKLTSFSGPWTMWALRKSFTPLEGKAPCSLLQRRRSFWPTTCHPNSDIADLHRVEEAALGIGALPPVTLKATPRWESRKMKEKQKMERNLFGYQKSLIWWKPQSRARIKESEGQRVRSKGMGWSHSSDKKQESTWSYLRAWSTERKLISVPTALYLHRAQILVS